jgi:hypothetical protein
MADTRYRKGVSYRNASTYRGGLDDGGTGTFPNLVTVVGSSRSASSLTGDARSISDVSGYARARETAQGGRPRG